MQTKRLLLASSALVLFAGAAEAQAGAYISVFGGANFLQDQSGTSVFVGTATTTTTLSVDTDADTGFVLGGAIGYDLGSWLNGLRIEAEAAYRRHDAAGIWTATTLGTTSSGLLDANISNFSVLGNIWYDVSLGSKAKFYVGGGAGWGIAKLDGALTGDDTAAVDNEETGFAYQFGAGFNYPVADDVAVGIGYRYFVGPDLPFDPIFGGLTTAPIDIENENHSAMLNLTIGIN